jgi:hypothetical protein
VSVIKPNIKAQDEKCLKVLAKDNNKSDYQTSNYDRRKVYQSFP